jgi:Lsr2
MPRMAQRVVIEKLDDTSGKPADETVRFGIDGRELEIDLTAKNAAALRKVFDVYITHGRRVGGRRARTSGSPALSSPPRSGGKVDTKDVRQWATKNGYTVSDRGRLPANVLDAYRAAQR